jgi:hypothetical protein
MPRNKECDQLVPDVLGGKTSPCLRITAFQHSIQQVTFVFTATLPLFDQLQRVSTDSSRFLVPPTSSAIECWSATSSSNSLSVARYSHEVPGSRRVFNPAAFRDRDMAWTNGGALSE